MSTKHNASPIDPLEEHLVNLLDELQLSGKWRRPSILLATYNSRLTFMDARLSLENKLRKRRQNVVHIVITPENYDILLHLSQIPAREKKIFFISGLMHGGGSNDLNAFRALNMRRELLVDHRLRAVFWLSEAEASTLTAHAVDFWAFRHRMFELQDQTSPERILKLVNDLDWSHWDAPTLLKESSAGVLLREELLAELPSAWDQTPRLKAQLLLMLAGLAWSQGNSARAAVLLQQGQQLAETLNQLPLLARFRLAAGQVQQLGGSLDLAVATYQQSRPARVCLGHAHPW